MVGVNLACVYVRFSLSPDDPVSRSRVGPQSRAARSSSPVSGDKPVMYFCVWEAELALSTSLVNNAVSDQKELVGSPMYKYQTPERGPSQRAGRGG